MTGRAADGEVVDRAMMVLAELRELRTDRPMPAEPMPRAAAKLLDAFIFAVLALAWLASAPLIFGWAEQEDPPPLEDQRPALTGAGTVYASTGVAVAVLAYLANEFGLASRSRQSIGRRQFDLHVLDARTMQRAALWRMALRFAVGAVPAWACLAVASARFGTWQGLGSFLLAFLVISFVPGLAFFRDDKRGLHDVVAGTTVVMSRHGASVLPA